MIEFPVFNANSVDPDQTPPSVTPDLGLHCLPMSFLRDVRLKWVNNETRHKLNLENVVGRSNKKCYIDTTRFLLYRGTYFIAGFAYLLISHLLPPPPPLRFFQLCFIPLLRISCRKMGARPG